MSAQAESERAIFRLFAESVELQIAPDTIESRNPPEPDIRCVLVDAGPRCFEMVEVVDADLAKAVGNQIKFQNRLANEAVARRVAGLSNALVFVSFARSSTNAEKLRACDVVLDVVQQLPDLFVGNIESGKHVGLASVVRRLRITRGSFVGPAFQVDGATFIADPIIERVQEKFAKRYASDVPIDLLVYYHLQPATRAEYELPEVAEYVSTNLAGSPFSRVWVFDAEKRLTLYRS